MTDAQRKTTTPDGLNIYHLDFVGKVVLAHEHNKAIAQQKARIDALLETALENDQCQESQSIKIGALEARIDELEREIDILRIYGNKDCTAMADEALAAGGIV